jgi:hypothetical protein
LVVLFVVVPARAQFPDDVDRMRYYEGELGLMLNAEALATGDLANIFIRDVPVTIDRSIETLDVDGVKALVQDASVLSGPTGPILSSEEVYAIDRKTMEHIENFSDDARVIDREGLVVGFPIGTDPEDYLGFNGDSLTTNTISFVGEEEHEGLTTYKFSAASGPDLISDPELLSSFPTELPKAVIEGLVPALGLPEEAAAQLGAVLPDLPDPIPLSYLYSYETTYWVEPDSGVLVDYNKLESRVVALNPGQPIPVGEVMHLEYAQTADSVADAVDDANDARGKLFWQGRVLPYGLIIGGVVVGLLGLLALRRRSSGPDSEPQPSTPSPATSGAGSRAA